MNHVRPAPAEAMMRAHAALLNDLRELRAVLRTRGDVTPLFLRLERLQAHLTRHFRCEERGGYLEEVRRREPQRKRVIEELLADHRRLSQGLADSLDEVRWASRLSDGLRGRIRHWVLAVRRHEARENRLVQDTFNRDLGPED